MNSAERFLTNWKNAASFFVMTFLPSITGPSSALPSLEKLRSDLQILEASWWKKSGNDFLDNGLRCAIAGVAWGLLEREIPPLTQKYQEAYETAVNDVTEAWNNMKDELNDPDLWKRETFDYGIKIAYYTEWVIDSRDIAF